MSRLLTSVIMVMLITATESVAQDRGYVGHGHLFTNDFLGDGDDRWRTGSYQSSWVWGSVADHGLPERFGQIIELRFGGEILSPEDLGVVVPGDRPFAGVVSFGLHTHFATRAMEHSAGVDLAFTGSQTGLDDFQSFLHDTLDAPDLSPGVRNLQIGNDLHPTLVIESARLFELSDHAHLRPYVEGRLGLESLLRAGADLTFGPVGRRGLMARDTVTGHRYRVADDGFTGAAFVLGGDIAYVDQSALLPESRGYTLSDERTRLRSGVHWQTAKGFSGFYGVTWLGKEFNGQRESQIVGSLRLKFSF